jgi:hypothetical protein
MCSLHRDHLSAGLAERIAPAPDRFDEFVAPRRIGQLFAKLADVDIDDLHRRLVDPSVHLREDDFLRDCFALP